MSIVYWVVGFFALMFVVSTLVDMYRPTCPDEGGGEVPPCPVHYDPLTWYIMEMVYGDGHTEWKVVKSDRESLRFGAEDDASIYLLEMRERNRQWKAQTTVVSSRVVAVKETGGET